MAGVARFGSPTKIEATAKIGLTENSAKPKIGLHRRFRYSRFDYRGRALSLLGFSSCHLVIFSSSHLLIDQLHRLFQNLIQGQVR